MGFQAEPEPGKDASQSLRKGWPKVLIVEDEPDAARLAAWVVQELWPRAEIHTAQDGDTAISDALRFKPNLVLTDIRIPGPNGIEVCRSIKKDANLAGSTKVVAMTGTGDPQLRQDALDTGADDFLTKPIEPEIWRRSLSRVMGQKPPPTSKGWSWVG